MARKLMFTAKVLYLRTANTTSFKLCNYFEAEVSTRTQERIRLPNVSGVLPCDHNFYLLITGRKTLQL